MGEARRRKLATAKLAIHPSSRLPEDCDAAGQYWLPPVWLWPEPPWLGSWEYQHEPEYLVQTGRAGSIGEAMFTLTNQRLRDRTKEDPEIVAAATRIAAAKGRSVDDVLDRALHLALGREQLSLGAAFTRIAPG